MDRRLVLLFAILLGQTGCAAGPQTGLLVESPLPTETQQAELLAIAPVGTPREETLQKLADAGLVIHQGASDTIYYCDVWNRPDGNRWRMNVALLFDKQGRLYRARSADALTSVDSGTDTPAPASVDLGPGTPAAPSEQRIARPSAAVTPAGANQPDDAPNAPRGQRTRTPFGREAGSI